jgi:uncharacterized lipoprotein YmbA
MAIAAALAASCMLAACSTPEPRYYVLGATGISAGERSSAGAPVLLTVVAIPAQVDRPQIVLAGAASEVLIEDGHRWAEPLQGAIAQALARDLASTLGEERVTTDVTGAAWTGYRAEVRILAFESRLDSGVRIDARWELRGSAVARTGTASVQEPAGTGFEGLVQAHSRALARISSAIAADVKNLDR